MLDIERFSKVLALAGSNIDGEALAALRKARTMLERASVSFTDLAQSLGAGGNGSGGNEATRLRQRLMAAEHLVETYLVKISRYERELKELHAARPRDKSRAGSLKRTRAEVAAQMRATLDDARLSILSDREIARRTGMSPQAVGNWRRRLEAEGAAQRRTVHNGRRRAA